MWLRGFVFLAPWLCHGLEQIFRGEVRRCVFVSERRYRSAGRLTCPRDWGYAPRGEFRKAERQVRGLYQAEEFSLAYGARLFGW